MAIVRWEPWTGFSSLRREMDRLFDDFGRGTGEEKGLATWNWAPAVDIYEKGEEYVVKANLPGMKKEDIKVSLHNGALTISGETKREQEVKEEYYYRSERAYGAFSRAIGLPSEVDPEKIKATYESGVLELRIPKAEKAKAKEIKIETN